MTTDAGTENLIRVARETGERANFRITAHEDLCAERWESAKTSLKDLRLSLDRLFSYGVAASGALIVGMATLIVLLIFKQNG